MIHVTSAARAPALSPPLLSQSLVGGITNCSREPRHHREEHEDACDASTDSVIENASRPEHHQGNTAYEAPRPRYWRTLLSPASRLPKPICPADAGAGDDHHGD